MTTLALIWILAAFAPQKINPWFYLGRVSKLIY